MKGVQKKWNISYDETVGSRRLDEFEVSLCESCGSLTNTLKSLCVRCGAKKVL